MSVPTAEDPAFDLLATLTARPLTPRRVDAIGACIDACIDTTPIDWTRFLALVERHRIAPLAFEGVTHARERFPADVVHALRAAAMRDRGHVLGLVGVLATVTNLLSAAGIATLSLKGPTLSMLVYGDACLRQCKDLDVLIARDDVPRALAILTAADFRLVSPAGIDPSDRSDRLALWMRLAKDVTLVHQPTGGLVELHWRLNQNPHLLGDSVRRSRQPVAIGPIDAETLAPRDLLLYLCVHGAEHFWFRLKWLADVHAMLADRAPQAITDFYDDARACGLGTPAGQMLLILEQIYGLPLPAEARSTALQSWRVRAVTRLALKTLRSLDEPDATRFGTTRLAATHLLLRPTPRFVLREIENLIVEPTAAMRPGPSPWRIIVAIAARPLFWLARKSRARRRA